MQRISETPINLARRAERALAAIDAQFVLDLGLIADYGRGSLTFSQVGADVLRLGAYFSPTGAALS